MHWTTQTDLQSEGNHYTTVSRIQLKVFTGSADPRGHLTKQDQQSHVTVVLIKDPCQVTRQAVADVARSQQLEATGADCHVHREISHMTLSFLMSTGDNCKHTTCVPSDAGQSSTWKLTHEA